MLGLLKEDFMEIKTHEVKVPEGINVILGQTHFIKSAEDLYEALVNSVPQIKFGLAFCEASGPCLVRFEGNDEELKKLASQTALEIAAGHFFVIYIKNAYPINVLNAIKQCREVCSIFCATANPVEVIIAETEQGKGILGVVDGFSSKRIESEKDIKERKELLRKIGYKL
jgi:adenosine/AMP kinase